MAAVEASDLHKNFGAVAALRGVSFAVPEGALFGLIGADGAGKTTLLRILVTLLAADKGSARILGHDAATRLAEIRRLVGYMPQRFSLYQDLSVRENLLFFADVFGVRAAERRARMEKLLGFSRLAQFQNRRAGHLSGGMKQKLALSCALIHTPTLLFLDEPTTGVDPVSRKEFWEILFELKKQGITIVASTPYMDEADACDELLLLHRGEVLRRGSPSELLASYPLTLYKVTNPAGSVSAPESAAPPPGVALMYPSAGALRVAAASGAPPPEAILLSLRSLAAGAVSIERAAPTIEDLFFYLLSSKEAR